MPTTRSASRWASAWRRTTWWPFAASAALWWLALPAPAAGSPSLPSPAERAWRQADGYLAAGRFREAGRIYRYVLRVAGPGERTLAERARLALGYRLPLAEARAHLADGDGPAALAALGRIEPAYLDHPRRGPLVRALRRRALALARRAPDRAGEAAVLAALRRRLDDYRARHGHFPRDVASLNRLLPPDRPPLEAYDIVGYRWGRGGYRLVLRRKGAPGGFVTLYGSAPLGP